MSSIALSDEALAALYAGNGLWFTSAVVYFGFRQRLTMRMLSKRRTSSDAAIRMLRDGDKWQGHRSSHHDIMAYLGGMNTAPALLAFLRLWAIWKSPRFLSTGTKKGDIKVDIMALLVLGMANFSQAFLNFTTSRKSGRWFRSFIWDTDSHLKSPEERWLLRKLDIALLTTGCLGFFLKYLDQTNLSNAYVSGMQEDLSMYGNEYTYAQTCYTVAYAIMQIPSTLIIQRVRPRYWLAAMEIGWGVFTIAQAGMHNVGELYAFRFLVGLFESSFFPCMLFVLGSWYTKTELAKRIAILHMTAPLGSAFSGYLQAAVYKNLNGNHGLEGWRWLYIVCGCMTIPVGAIALFCFPDIPHNTKAWYLTSEEVQMCLDRVQRSGKAPPAKLSWATFKRVAMKWRWYAFTLGYVLYGSSCAASSYFAIWLKSENFSVSERNIIPTGTNLISAFCVVLWGFLADFTGNRFALVILPLTYGLIPNGILAAWPASIKLKEFAFLTDGVQLMTAIFYTWANEVCADDNEERALVVSSMNGFQYAVAAWLPVVIFPQTEAPSFRKGFPATFAFVIAALILIVVIQLLAVRERRLNALKAEENSVGEGEGRSQPEESEEEQITKKGAKTTVSAQIDV
ncbi:MFS general substrate transporter [Aspergillus steynii IBT 23096]|uniref:MFS general substrate transporter n=1 Tax=Aspergillus steynii IBT 23096 TaxID=1392250 RepID=A0A2I2G6F1_9EURO|nr:MFS general substrate transporter [Aspergillus steynii IBT 23096]PLB48448.1 MFS general substrate transporter [Aspergillus steynii IBT 23096]